MSPSDSFDNLFQQAVAAIDEGNTANLRSLLEAHPELASEHLESPGAWLRQEVGDALDGFFSRPYLLWFVAEDPVRKGALAANVPEIAGIVIGTARRGNAPNLQEQLDSALPLVCWSGVAAECGVQLALIDVLVDAGAMPGKNANNALVNGHVAAAERLLARGGTLTLGAALCLERWDALPTLVAQASEAQRQFGFVLAALNGKAEALRWMIGSGTDVNRPSADLYAHGTPLHHAVCSGSLDAVKVLVAAGADLDVHDSAWNATPLGWAEYYAQNAPVARVAKYHAIAAYLREQASARSAAEP